MSWFTGNRNFDPRALATQGTHPAEKFVAFKPAHAEPRKVEKQGDMKVPPFILNSLDDKGCSLLRADAAPNDPRSESWLQELLYTHPELLPVDEFGESFSPPIPIGREVPTNAGPIDNLFVSPFGGITVVETKLWKNPEKHRTVVAQIIDYAKELATWCYDDFSAAVLTSSKGRKEAKNLSLEEKVATGLASSGVESHEFQEAVAATLAGGDFLLLIVGDRISPNIALLTKAIQSSPGLGFTLGLLELRMYQMTADNAWPLVVVPEVLGRTVEQTRGVVRVEYVKEKPQVTVEPETPGAPQVWTLEKFMAALRRKWGEPAAKVANDLLDWLKPQVSYLWFGQGAEGAIIPMIEQGGLEYHVCRMTTRGRVIIHFEWLYVRPAFADEQVRRGILAMLNEIPGVHFDADVLTKRARIEFTQLENTAALEQLKSTLGWIIRHIREQ